MRALAVLPEATTHKTNVLVHSNWENGASSLAAMFDILFYFLLLVMLAGAGVACAALAKSYFERDESGGGLFGAKSEKRLEVVEQSNVDGRRKLLLVRRDQMEHLIMTGGPVDVVIETNIAPVTSASLTTVATTAEARAPRTFGRVTAAE